MLLLLFLGLLAATKGGRFLPKYDPQSCAKRIIHDRYEGHGYMFSWEDSRTAQLELNWPEAREFCRTRCMDLVSLETKAESNLIKNHVLKGNQKYIWTSGRKCNFDGCDRPDLMPINVYGWFWTGSLHKMPPTTNRLDTDWSDTGGLGRPQPDDREHQQGGVEEECLALLNNFFEDGVRWHDIACHHRKPFVCEDSDYLIQTALANNAELAAELTLQSQSHYTHPGEPQYIQPAEGQPQLIQQTTTKKTRVEQEPPPPHHSVPVVPASAYINKGFDRESVEFGHKKESSTNFRSTFLDCQDKSSSSEESDEDM